MKIMIFISSLSIGGAEKQAVIDANLLSKVHNVFLVAFKKGALEGEINPNVHFYLIKKKKYISTAFNLAKIIKYQKIDVVHASLFAPMVISILATLHSKIPVFWHFHSHEYDIPKRSSIAFKLLACSPSLKKILFVNKELLEYFIKRFNWPRRKLGILYNCSQFQLRRISTKKKNVLTIGFVGRLVELKRVNYIIDLAAHLIENGQINFEILIIGDGYSRPDLERYARDLHVDRYVKFVGFQNKLEEWYRRLDLFINPSREECLSMALIDAGMLNVPAIAFDVGGNGEIIHSGLSGFIVRTKEELFTKTLLLLTKAYLREQMGYAAREYCNKKFSEKKHLQDLMALYREFHA